MKNISILGSTGSIGKSTLDFVASNSDKFNVVGLSANSSIDLLKEQIINFKPEIVTVTNEEASRHLISWVDNTRNTTTAVNELTVFTGEEGLCDFASHEKADIVISSIVGASGLKPTLAAIRAGKEIGLANKETLVMAGNLVMDEARKHNVRILPVDSEHSAIFQCLEGRKTSDIRRLILTASGGPFFGKNAADLKNVTAKEALKHPNWSMGSKITIDSSTLMNKGLEVIEAHHLFGFPPEKIDVLIHPQSIVHSMVEFNDAGMLAQLSQPDMKGPIAYALSYPDRVHNVISRCFLEEIGALTFHSPDTATFPCLQFAYEALKGGGTLPAVLNASNEVLVELFLKGDINFTDIPAIIENVMSDHNISPANDLETIFEADRMARSETIDKVRRRL